MGPAQHGGATTLTFPSSLSSRAKTPVLSVNSFTLTAGNGWVVVKSPCVPHLMGRQRDFSSVSRIERSSFCAVLNGLVF